LLLQNLHEDYPHLVVLSVDSKEDAATVQAFADEHDLTFTIVLDGDGKVSRAYRVYAIPSLFFVDSQGVIQGRSVGTPAEVQLGESLAAIGAVP
jgi:peroxiredoxin